MQIFGTSAATQALLGTAQAHAQTQAQAQTQAPAAQALARPVNSLTSEQTFLQLLIAQIKNQDPLNPTDSIQFVGQLVQCSELEQLMGINQGVQNLTGHQPPTTPTNPRDLV